jgi:hypothetical protein
MAKVTEHEGKKYLRPIVDPTSGSVSSVDVYAVLEAFNVRCPAIAHAVKKLLMPGQRGKGDIKADLVGAQAALSRALELQLQREGLQRLREEAQAKASAEETQASAKDESEEDARKRLDMMTARAAAAEQQARLEKVRQPIPMSKRLDASEGEEEVMQIPLDKIGAKAVEIHNQTTGEIKKLQAEADNAAE